MSSTLTIPKQEPGRISVRELMFNKKKVILEHQGFDYILRITRNGKLILTK